MKLFGLIGYPLGHSFSKKYFTRKFEEEGIRECAYELFPIEHINQLPDLISSQRNLAGFNITIPYKKDVLKYLTDRSALPVGLDACNCVRISRDGSGNASVLKGFNTDVPGFRLSISPLLNEAHRTALILGNGGATVAVRHALAEMSIVWKVVSRQYVNGVDLTYSDLTPDVIEWADIIINTTPLGTHPDIHNCPDIPYAAITPRHVLYDLVYNPDVTLFMQRGADRGATVKNGYDMLVIQAEESWRIWNS